MHLLCGIQHCHQHCSSASPLMTGWDSNHGNQIPPQPAYNADIRSPLLPLHEAWPGEIPHHHFHHHQCNQHPILEMLPYLQELEATMFPWYPLQQHMWQRLPLLSTGYLPHHIVGPHVIPEPIVNDYPRARHIESLVRIDIFCWRVCHINSMQNLCCLLKDTNLTWPDMVLSSLLCKQLTLWMMETL